MNKIQKLSRCFKMLFYIMLFLWIPSKFIIYFFDANIHFQGFEISLFKDQNLIDYLKLGTSYKLLIVLVNSLLDFFAIYILHNLTNLFRLYESGQYFLSQNIMHIRKIGFAMLIATIIDPFHQLLITGILSSFANPPGARTMSVTMDNTDIYWIVTAGMIYLISWVMDEGRKLQEDAEHTI